MEHSEVHDRRGAVRRQSNRDYDKRLLNTYLLILLMLST